MFVMNYLHISKRKKDQTLNIVTTFLLEATGNDIFVDYHVALEWNCEWVTMDKVV